MVRRRKQPRGSNVDGIRDANRTFALQTTSEVQVKLSSVADIMQNMEEAELAEVSKRLRRDVQRLEHRIKRVDVSKKKVTAE